MSDLETRLATVRQRMAAAATRAGVPPESVQLVAVTKYSTDARLQQLYELGLRHFGESRPQQLSVRAPQHPADICWHMIGHLQSNKINKVLPHVGLLQSLDSTSLAEAIDKRASGLPQPLPVLLEVKTSTEESKSGVSLEAAADAWAHIASLSHLQLRGLMTMAPHTDDEATVRRSFQALRRVFDTLPADPSSPLVLSMGMSQDFEWAIEEGATMVRIGRALVGE